MEELLKAIFSQYGALGMGWLLAIFLLWKKFGDDAVVREALDKNTKALTEFKVLLTERLPRGGSQ